ncbi:MAG: 30S ribosomal protein S2 [Candidatus Berkelbacteria bacterium]
MLKLPTLREMLDAGAHFGHKTSRWQPSMTPYIFTVKSGVHIINLEKTEEKLKEAVAHVSDLIAKGKIVVFVGTKKQSSEIVKKAAVACAMPYVNVRWLGGTITNFNTVKTSIKKYEKIKAELDNADSLEMPKSEISKLRKQVLRGDKFLEGLSKLDRKPDALILFGAHDEKNALKEAKTAGIELIAICDTNSNPQEIDFPVPANDDATKSIEMFANVFAQAIIAAKPRVEIKN